MLRRAGPSHPRPPRLPRRTWRTRSAKRSGYASEERDATGYAAPHAPGLRAGRKQTDYQNLLQSLCAPVASDVLHLGLHNLAIVAGGVDEVPVARVDADVIHGL